MAFIILPTVVLKHFKCIISGACQHENSMINVTYIKHERSKKNLKNHTIYCDNNEVTVLEEFIESK